jgi:DNA repair protein SbcD/Mre11
MDVRLLLLADSHLGFDLPVRARSDRRRRGHDFLANYAAALAPAINAEVDIVVHAGDVFNRSSVVKSLAYQAYAPLLRVADRGTPVFIVPGNHERSRLPHSRFLVHPNVHVFDRPRTFVADVRGYSIALSGFPYEREDVRTKFASLVEQTEWRSAPATHRLLCIHHCVEGATVGPGNFTFTTASDVIRLRQVPPEFAAVLTGHVHRHQVLTTDLERRPLRAPVFYPGSIERTSFAEIDEPKGFMIVRFDSAQAKLQWEFRQLPARPMIRHELDAEKLDAPALDSAIRMSVREAPNDAVISIRIGGALTEAHWRTFSSARLREFVPQTMNVDVVPAEGFDHRAPASSSPNATTRISELRPGEQLSFY